MFQVLLRILFRLVYRVKWNCISQSNKLLVSAFLPKQTIASSDTKLLSQRFRWNYFSCLKINDACNNKDKQVRVYVMLS